MDEIILEAKNISKKFLKAKDGIFNKDEFKVAVEDVSLQLYKGEIHGIVGESGSGKSTLANILVRLLKEDSGKIFYKNKDITNLDKKSLRLMRKEIQMIFQNTYASLNPSKKTSWLLKESLDINTNLTENEKLKKINEMIDIIGLKPKHLNRFPKDLSGGERQRICIGIALMLNPEIIIADEAVSALDVSVQAQILNLMMELKERFSLSYFFISHDLNVINYLSDRISVMYNGRIIESGKAEDIFYNPKEEYTKKLFNSVKKIRYSQVDFKQ